MLRLEAKDLTIFIPLITDEKIVRHKAVCILSMGRVGLHAAMELA
jgi:hypothetical protein